MNRSAKFTLLLFLLLLFSTYVPKNEVEEKSLIFPIRNIKIKNINVINEKELIKKLSFLKGKNILFINEEEIKSVITKFDFVSSFQVKKIYPETIEILINEKDPVAIYIDGKQRFYISEKGEKINYVEIKKFNHLPLIFGKKIQFHNFFKDLKEINFPMKDVKSLHYFDIGRWDIVLKNEKTIKLPKKNYQKILKEFLLIYNDDNFKKYKLFDYRIKNQLILN